ncbi:hypothetical protein GXM_01580 [Nostoc sphaeroides CCNUC1]|uniref:Uncharacterized protein n=1 Tax=Nostoc sphaeroides CCNUC1 TaxID=2653204 RepID=A0A5P8VUN9_9NOSO|nr:hypothetical protein GXM_01580 [Nostoc sphaeroides CCNUC1]
MGSAYKKHCQNKINIYLPKYLLRIFQVCSIPTAKEIPNKKYSIIYCGVELGST